LLAKGLKISPPSVDYSDTSERITLNFDGELLECEGKLTLKYNGHLRDDLKGFYRSAQSTGEDKKYAAVTHFEVGSYHIFQILLYKI